MTGDRPRLRRLSADEHKLWTTVTRAITPLKPARLRQPLPEEPESAAAAAEQKARPVAGEPVAPRAAKVAGPPSPIRLERRLRQRLGKGHAPIDGRLDLHGMTQREAHGALAHFVRAEQARGAKVVLVVTGKGRASEGRLSAADPVLERGVLRRLVPQWLSAPELRHFVVGFEAAHIGHGGEGALYVQLRRARTRATK